MAKAQGFTTTARGGAITICCNITLTIHPNVIITIYRDITLYQETSSDSIANLNNGTIIMQMYDVALFQLRGLQ